MCVQSQYSVYFYFKANFELHLDDNYGKCLEALYTHWNVLDAFMKCPLLKI